MKAGVFFGMAAVDQHHHAFETDHEIVRLASDGRTEAVAGSVAAGRHLLIRLFDAFLERRHQLRQ